MQVFLNKIFVDIFALLHYGENLSSKCKMYVVFALFGLARVKWNISLTIDVFII